MKTIAFALTVILSSANALAADSTAPVASSLASPALAAVCSAGVSPFSHRAGYWHLNYPHFAQAEKTVFASIDLAEAAPGQYAIVKVDANQPESYTEIARIAHPVHALSFHDGKVWVLLQNQILTVNPVSGAVTEEANTTKDQLSADDEGARSFAWMGNQLVITHGSLGLAIYDPASKTITKTDGLGLGVNGQLSVATYVTPVNDHQVAIAVEGLTVSEKPPFAFNGILIYDLNGGRTERYAYDAAHAGELANATLRVSGDQLIINNWGILQKASLTAMRKSGTVNVSWTPIRFTAGGASQPGELLGDLLLDQGQILACGEVQYQDAASKKIVHQGVVYTGKY